ncbi:MAG: hypothetical protein WED04_12135 [Promethearchaeati archaeon SRVP18_Atabeyarchaeia-1]
MPQLEAKGEIEQAKLRLKSLLISSGLQIVEETSSSLTFRKVRLNPNREFPLSIYGSGAMKFEASRRGLTTVNYSLNTSPTTVLSFLITGLSVVLFAFFVDYSLASSVEGFTTEVIVDISVVTLVSSLVVLVLVLSFVATKRRAESFLKSFVEEPSRSSKSDQ